MIFKCETCGKEYSRKDFYDKHKLNCVTQMMDIPAIVQEYTTQDINTMVENTEPIEKIDTQVDKEEETKDIIETKSETKGIPLTMGTKKDLVMRDFALSKPIKSVPPKNESESHSKCPFCDKTIKIGEMYLHKIYCYKNPQNNG